MLTGLPYVKEQVARELERGTISKLDAQYLLQYFTKLKTKDKIADSSLRVWYMNIRSWFPYLQFSTATNADLEQALLELDAPRMRKYGTRESEGKLKQNYTRGVVYQLKRYLLWMQKNKYTSISKEDIEEIKLPKRDTMTRTAEMMINEADADRLVATAWTTRDRFLLALLFRGGLRPVEAINLDWQDIHIDDYGLIINTKEKTGIPRKVRVLGITELHGTWKADYKQFGEPKGEAPVFVMLKAPYGRISYQSMWHVLRAVVKRSGFDKKMSLYILRHSKITSMIANGTHESAVRQQFWGSQKSHMLENYLHLAEDQTDRMILEAAGIVKKGEQKKVEIPKCPRCFRENPIGADYCLKCGTGLTKEAIDEQETAMTMLAGKKYTPEQIKTAMEILTVCSKSK